MQQHMQWKGKKKTRLPGINLNLNFPGHPISLLPLASDFTFHSSPTSFRFLRYNKPHFTPPLLASDFSVIINTLALHQPDPIAFMPVVVDTSGRIYDDFSRLQFLHDHREVSTLVNELPSVGECHDDLTYSF